jgi:hypothetical protein
MRRRTNSAAVANKAMPVIVEVKSDEFCTLDFI